MSLKESILKLMRGENLSFTTCHNIMDEILDPKSSDLQIAALLVLLRQKRETAEELFALVSALRAKMISVSTPHRVLDIVGTGGDGFKTINISTGSAILAASAGIKVAKHGNRAVSSLTGSADVLEALGINIHLSPDKISQCIDEIGIGFCFSPHFHKATSAVSSMRKELNVPTIFNDIGPLLNPVSIEHLILGVSNPESLSTMAEVLMLLNTRRSVIVHGMGLDEISSVGPFNIIEVDHQEKNEFTLDPKTLGLSYCTISDLQGSDAHANAKLLLDTFKGKKGPLADTLALNVAVALYIYGTYKSLDDALSYAQECLANGRAYTLLNNWTQFSHDQ